MGSFCFTVDDNIRFLKDLSEKNDTGIFDHLYLAMYKRLHDAFGLKMQLNLFYRMEGFDLAQMPDMYYQKIEEKLTATFSFLQEQGYRSCFFEDLI